MQGILQMQCSKGLQKNYSISCQLNKLDFDEFFRILSTSWKFDQSAVDQTNTLFATFSISSKFCFIYCFRRKLDICARGSIPKPSWREFFVYFAEPLDCVTETGFYRYDMAARPIQSESYLGYLLALGARFVQQLVVSSNKAIISVCLTS